MTHECTRHSSAHACTQGSLITTGELAHNLADPCHPHDSLSVVVATDPQD